VESRLQNLKSNLRYLCGYHRSVAEVCRRVAINRQQFNKYLAGAGSNPFSSSGLHKPPRFELYRQIAGLVRYLGDAGFLVSHARRLRT
jgi:hypothetical protein